MVAERGMLRFGTITFYDENQEEIALYRVPKDQIEKFIDSLKQALNMIAVEPISIKRSKEIGGRMNWEFKKPSEMVFRSSTYLEQQKALPQTPSQNHNLIILKPLKNSREGMCLARLY